MTKTNVHTVVRLETYFEPMQPTPDESPTMLTLPPSIEFTHHARPTIGDRLRRSACMLVACVASAALTACAERSSGTSVNGAGSTAASAGTSAPSPTSTGSGTTGASGVNPSSAGTLNSSAVSPAPSTAVTPSSAPSTDKALFGAGCFWGVEHIFAEQTGVIDAVSGYAGGHVKNPTYEQICTDLTGHAEVVLVTFDPAKVSYEQLVDIFFRLHDPTQINRQGPDIGTQYRSVIFTYNDEQKRIAEAVKARRAAKHKRPIATTIEPAPEFYVAEKYHQDYYVKTGKQPYCHFLRED